MGLGNQYLGRSTVNARGAEREVRERQSLVQDFPGKLRDRGGILHQGALSLQPWSPLPFPLPARDQHGPVEQHELWRCRWPGLRC